MLSSNIAFILVVVYVPPIGSSILQREIGMVIQRIGSTILGILRASFLNCMLVNGG